MTDFVLRDIDPNMADRIKRLADARGWNMHVTLEHLLQHGLLACEPRLARALQRPRVECAGTGDRGDGKRRGRPGLRVDRPCAGTAARRRISPGSLGRGSLTSAGTRHRARADRARRSPPAGCRARPARVSRASQAKAIASTKSGSRPCAAVDSTRTPGKCAAMRAQQHRVVHAAAARQHARACPGWCARSASATVRAVSSSSVACTSAGASPPRTCAVAASRDGSVRGRCSSAAAARTRARASRRAEQRLVDAAAARRTRRRASNGVPRCRSHHASISAFAGPVSKPRTSPCAGSSVKLAMPPRLSTARSSFASCSSAAWKAGTSGAPWPPAATSRRRKSATVVDAACVRRSRWRRRAAR